MGNSGYIEDEIYRQVDFAERGFRKATYEGCRFEGCNLERADLSGARFSDCVFVNCNISNASLRKTAFQDVEFTGCKLLGLHFNECEAMLFEASFRACVLDYCLFTGMRLKKQAFWNCSLREADLSRADLAGARFDGSVLSGTRFEGANLEKADFRSALDFSIDPASVKLKGALFSQAGLEGLLRHLGIRIEA
ncbi:pentapeptide repeat-containing protein [Flaviaesturariibacter flavus]|uniref:Pentapeptide repeat-containing protein n=1 Tax=Flaviaesturariibacter flavus TaxID=2502780 RepID=A0A4R1BC09_9BACT|nr:pentapeptide repeat-containing protein [Flaviaesturariibacter flavus]TCJ14524.1 pentapeptide repeat-containing protein [Flaviaesturariibacter flavus]